MKLNLKEKYLIILVVLGFISVGFYYSYAIFVTKQLQENVVVVKVADNRVSLSIDGNDNKIDIKGNTSQDINIKLTNNQNTNYYYLLMVTGLKSGVKVSSINEMYGSINPLEIKDLIVHVNNTTKEDIKLEFIVNISNDSSIDKEVGYNYINSTDNFDHTKANKPEINNLKLIPVSYKKTSDKEGFWYKTDYNNQTDLWYSYENGLWANAVLLNNDNYNKYKDKEIGSEIEIGDILGFYVWIPRFRYNIVNNSNYTNYERMSNIVFEEGNSTTGTINCYDQISTTSDNHVYSEVCSDNYYNNIYDNLSTYTHPAFKNKNGFWVSKFVMGTSEKVLPNVTILKKNIKDANAISNKYNAHVLTNMEYGAIALLSNSAYGKVGNSMYYKEDDKTFTRIYSNTYEYGLTGCSSDYSNRSSGFETKISKKCIAYNDLTNYSHISNSVNYQIGPVGSGASSTGTINGVYDLVSIDGEIVAAFVANKDGKVNTNIKTYDTYSYNEYIGKVGSSSNIYNLYRYKLGDGIKENFRNFGDSGMWYSGTFTQNANSGIILRGLNNSLYSISVEESNYVAPFRIVLN